MNSCGLWWAKPSSNGITTSSSTPSVGDQLGLDLEAGEQLGRGLGAHHAQRMGLERQHRVVAVDHLAVAEVDAVELADGEPPRRGSASARSVTRIAREA